MYEKSRTLEGETPTLFAGVGIDTVFETRVGTSHSRGEWSPHRRHDSEWVSLVLGKRRKHVVL